jgi:hypothetical protein
MSGTAAEAVTAIVFDAAPAQAGATQVEAAGKRIIDTNAAVVNATTRTVDVQANMERALARLTRQIDPAAAVSPPPMTMSPGPPRSWGSGSGRRASSCRTSSCRCRAASLS